jgi:threonine dehydrogenase-like Zn-dependent dehydrogenase
MHKLMELVRHGKLQLDPLITHSFSLDDIGDAYELFGNQRDGVVKVALYPAGVPENAPGRHHAAGVTA